MKILDKIEEFLVLFGLGLMGVVLAFQIFMRYVLNQPLVWSEEFARYVFVWVTFIGAGYGVRHGIHIAMEVVFMRLPKKAQFVVRIATNLAGIAAFAYLIPTGLSFTAEQSHILSSAMQIPMSWVIAAVPVGSILICFRLIVNTVRIIRTKGEAL